MLHTSTVFTHYQHSDSLVWLKIIFSVLYTFCYPKIVICDILEIRSYLCRNIPRQSLSFSCPPLYCAPSSPRPRSLLRSLKRTPPSSTIIAFAWRNWLHCAAAVSLPRLVSSDSSTLELRCKNDIINSLSLYLYTIYMPAYES